MAIHRWVKKNLLLRCKLGALILLPFVPYFFSLDVLDEKHSFCLFQNLFGIECYGCGITKAVIAVMQFDFVRAFHYNKLIVIVMPLLIYVWTKEVIACVKMLK